MEKIIVIDMYGNETELNANKLVCEKCVYEMDLTYLLWYEIPTDGTCPLCGREHNGMLYERVE